MTYFYIKFVILGLTSFYVCAHQNGVSRVYRHFDDFIQTCYEEGTNNCVTRKLTSYADYYAPVLDVAAAAGGLILASKYHKRITFNSVSVAAAGTYFANRLVPDWLKDFCSHVPLIRYLVSKRRMRDKGFNSPTFAIVEYGIMGALAWTVAKDFKSTYLVPCMALAYLARLVAPPRVRENILKVPVLRRLI